MNDVVDLAVLLRSARSDVRGSHSVSREAVDISFAQIEGRGPRVHPLRNRHADTAGVGDPHRFGHPETAKIGRFADQRHAVWGKGEHAVDAVRQVDIAQRRQELDGVGMSRLEVLWSKSHQRGSTCSLDAIQDVVRVHQERLVLVGADAVTVGVLAEIHGAILMAQHGVHDLSGLSGQFRKWCRNRVLMLHRSQRGWRRPPCGRYGAPRCRR